MPIEGKSKTTKKRTCWLLTNNSPYWGKDLGPMLNQGNIHSPIPIFSKKLIHLLRLGKQVHREDDGAIEFWRIKDNLQKHFPYCPYWSDDRWKKRMAGGGGNKKRYQYCTDSSGTVVHPELFKVIQDAILLVLLYRTM